MKAFTSLFFFVILSIVLFSSCSTYKQLQYLQGDIDSVKYSQFKVPEQRIQKGGQIAITVFSDNVTASALFNTGAAAVGLQSVGTQAVNTGANAGAGNVYDVDLDGNIFFPQVGVLHVEGLTKGQLKQLLDSKQKDKFLSNPYYVIRFLNLKITVFGDVGYPGIYPLTRENIKILKLSRWQGI